MNALQAIDYVLNTVMIAVLATLILLSIFALVVLVSRALIDIYYKIQEWRER